MVGGVSLLATNLVAGGINSTGTVFVSAGGLLHVTNGVISIGNNGTVNSGAGVGQLLITNGTVEASTIMLGSSVGGRGNR